MQRVAQPVLDRPGALLPVARVVEPGFAVAHVGPGADERHAHHQCLDVTLHVVDASDPLGYEVGIEPTVQTGQLLEQLAEQLHVVIEQELAEIRNAAHVPQERHRVAALRPSPDRGPRRERDKRAVILGPLHEPEQPGTRSLRERRAQGVHRGEI